MSNSTVKRAVLLAAGRGSRLRPHTDITPKPLLVHRGKPTLDYLLDSLADAGIDDIVLVTHYLHEQVERYAELRTAGGNQRLRCVHQSHLFGTAHALQAVIEAVPDIVAAPFVLSATDYIVPRAFFVELMQFHAAHQGEMSASLKQLDPSELAKRSSVRFNEDRSLAEIVEKPEEGTAPSSIGANLTFVLPADIVPYVQNVPVSSRGEQEVQHAINQWLVEGGRAFGLVQDVPPEWQAPDQA